MKKQSVPRISPPKIEKELNRLRCEMAMLVQEIYRACGMSDTQFHKLMGAELGMSAEGVRLFLHKRQRIHQKLMFPGKLNEMLEKIFTEYIKDEQIKKAAREKAKRTWETDAKKYQEKIENAVYYYNLGKKCKSFSQKDYKLMEDVDGDVQKYEEIMKHIKLVADFLTQKWPENPNSGLSHEETMELRKAISDCYIARDYKKYCEKKYGKVN